MVKDAPTSPGRRGRPRKSVDDRDVVFKSRSPARSPSRRLPSRTTRSNAAPKSPKKSSDSKSPVKKSSKDSPKKTKTRPKSVTRTEKSKPAPAKVVTISDSESDSDKTTTSVSTTKSHSRPPSREHTYEVLNNLRSRAQREVPKQSSLLRSNYEPVRKFIEYSDEDEELVVAKPPQAKSQSQSKHIAEFVVCVLYCLFALCLTYIMPLLCTESKCEFRMPTVKDLDRIVESFDLSVFLTFTAFMLFNGIVSIIPFGGKKYSSMIPLDGNFKYILNGLFSLVLQITILISLEIYHIPVTSYIVNNHFKLLTASVVFTFVLGFVLLAKSLYTNKNQYTTSNDQNVLYKFIMGSEINPRFGPMDIKFVSIRVCILGTILFNLCLLYQSMEMISTPPIDPKTDLTPSAWTIHMLQSIRIRPTLSIITTLYTIYFADQFFFESAQFSMLEFKAVRFGFLKCNEFITGLFIISMMPKYIYDYNIELPNWELGLSTALFLLGYIIYRGSNSQKHVFRENPYSPVCSKFESIPTTTGKKLLCSGYWGIVRHPNYLGDILQHLSFLRYVWGTPVMIVYIFMLLQLVLRAVYDNKQCKERYGAAWDRYCQRVPYLLIPKVF